MHPEFGIGRIVSMEGAGPKRKGTVVFTVAESHEPSCWPFPRCVRSAKPADPGPLPTGERAQPSLRSTVNLTIELTREQGSRS